MSKSNSFIYFISFIAAMGGLMFGFDIAIISGAVPLIQPYFNWNELELGWGVSSLLVGAIIGSLASGALTDKYGRKSILIAVAFLFAITCGATALATNSTIFILARLFGGLSVGAASVLSPMYVAEVSPPDKRGMLVSIYQLAIVSGILISYFINFALLKVENNWRWMFASGTIPSVLFFAGLFLIPESPRWLYKSGDKEGALKVLIKIVGLDLAKEEILEIAESLKETINSANFKELFKMDVRKAVFVGFFLAILIQVSGINTVIEYAPKILLAAGVDIQNALLQTSFIGLINFVFTFVAIFFIDKVGRRKLYLIGSLGMTINLLLLAVSFYFNLNDLLILIFIMLFIAFFAACIGPVFWTLVSEIFPNKIRGMAVALASFIQWIFNFLVVLLFPHFLSMVGGATTFFVLAVMAFIQFMFTHSKVPETKGKTLEEIELYWKIDK